MPCCVRDKRLECAHCGNAITHLCRTVMFYGVVLNFCDSHCQGRFADDWTSSFKS